MLNIAKIPLNNNSARFRKAFEALEPLQLPYSQIVNLITNTTGIKAADVYSFIAGMATPSAHNLKKMEVLFNILKRDHKQCANDCFESPLTDYADKHGV